MTITIAPVTEDKLAAFIEGVQKINNDYMAKYHPSLKADKISYEMGPKNIRVIKTVTGNNGEAGQRSVHCFINRETGNILKAAGWKAPAPNGVRGNINADDHGLSCVNQHGTHYLR